jgi:glycosyltransferase involved in cell wall biosynthesis
LLIQTKIKEHYEDQSRGFEKMKALLVFPGPELGGAERQGMHLARNLKSQGCEVHVWSTLSGHGRVVEECAAENIPWAAHRFLWPCRKSSLVRDGLHLMRALRRLRPDVIVSYTTSPNVGCGLFWRFTPAKVCIWGQRNTSDLRGDRIERLAFRQVSAVVCNAAHEVEYLEKTLGKSKIPIHVVSNGLAPAPIAKTRQAWRSDLNIPQNAVVAVMLANFRPQKDHTTLLNAWAGMLKDANPDQPRPCLVLAGAPQFTFQEVRQLAEELKIIDTIRFPGQVHDVSGLLAACDIGVLISKREGLSNAVLEYMAAGLPVITTDLPGNREALGDGSENAFCLPENSNDLAERLLRLMLNPDARYVMGEQNRQRAEIRFSIEAMCEKTTEIAINLSERAG